MGKGGTTNFTAEDWAALGRGDIKDQAIIEEMLKEGYESMEDEDGFL